VDVESAGRFRLAFAWIFVAVTIRLAIASALLWFALDWRSPALSAIRPWALTGLVALPICLIAADLWTLRSTRWTSAVTGALSLLGLTLAALALLSTLALEARFQWMRHEVLQADPGQLQRLGRHVVVGYRTLDEARELSGRGAVAGIYVSANNVRDRDVAQIRQDIAELQEARRQHDLPPLWIATDQEGGLVSRLSPPLRHLPPIGDIVAQQPDPARRREAIRDYAAQQGRDLADLGVNLNLAPVIDLDHQVINPNDRYTRIHQRAISADPQVVTEVAAAYCESLNDAGVACTLKHFPGLGRVREDTHQESADLATPSSDLAASDWIPFRALMRGPAFTMLGHARLVALDREHPASSSRAVIAGLLRGDWKHDGVLITDDLCMGAVYRSHDGIAGASVAALNAGVDLILVTWDPDQYYPIMFALIAADHAGRLERDALERSNHRLNTAERITATRSGVPAPTETP
jgi:beta-N-acetylhexosaminidase